MHLLRRLVVIDSLNVIVSTIQQEMTGANLETALPEKEQK